MGISFQVNDTQLRALCNVIGATENTLLSKSVLTKKLCDAGIVPWVNPVKAPPGYWVKGPNKADWLYLSLDAEIKQTHSDECVVRFLQTTFDPISYTSDGGRSEYQRILTATNKVLSMIGWEIADDGKLTQAGIAKTLGEVDRRFDELSLMLNRRGVDDRVRHYTKDDISRNDYGSAALESVKSLMKRVQELTGLQSDGRRLFEEAFSSKNAYLRINKGETKSEQDEQTGLKDFFCGLLGLVRNPLSHTVKLDWNIGEQESVDILVLTSIGHRYLDRCFPVPGRCHAP